MDLSEFLEIHNLTVKQKKGRRPPLLLKQQFVRASSQRIWRAVWILMGSTTGAARSNRPVNPSTWMAPGGQS